LSYASKANKVFYENSESLGIVLMDFPGEKLIANIINNNYN
jgi:hypothetical protein